MSQNFKNFAELWWKDNFCEIFVCISTQWLSIQSLWLNCFLSFKPKFCFSTDTPSNICPLPKIAFWFWRNSNILDIFWTKIMTGEDLYKSLIFWIFNFDIRLWYKHQSHPTLDFCLQQLSGLAQHSQRWAARWEGAHYLIISGPICSNLFPEKFAVLFL